MQHRVFIQTLATLPALAEAAPWHRYLIQVCPLGGLLHHHGDLLRPRTNAGDLAHDANAIRVEWNGHRLDHIPRDRNLATARLMDEGKSLESRISRLETHPNPWRRVRLEVWRVV